MSKIKVVVSCPVDTYSGYGARARDFVQALLEIGKYDVRILSQRWGNVRQGYLEDHKRDDLSSLIIPQLTYEPDVWIQITVPNEFQRVGKYNIGVTAGIETTLAAPQWIMGCNVMDLVITSSKHSKVVFEESKYDMTDQTKGTTEKIELKKPLEILIEGAHTDKYTPLALPAKFNLKEIPENFCFLNVGHWLPGSLGNDRKNIGLLVRLFFETYKNKPNPPALILKTSMVTSSIIDRNKILSNIEKIKNDVKGTLPNVYLLHGDLTDEEMNELYNNSKVKAMISLTKGEGFGRPLLEFSTTRKPIIASNWSAHTEFLNKDFTPLIDGKLENVHPSAAIKDMILTEAQWFQVDHGQTGFYLKDVFENYKKYLDGAKRQAYRSRTEFSWDKMKEKLNLILTSNIPEFPKEIKLELPKLQLPKLEKING